MIWITRSTFSSPHTCPPPASRSAFLLLLCRCWYLPSFFLIGQIVSAFIFALKSHATFPIFSNSLWHILKEVSLIFLFSSLFLFLLYSHSQTLNHLQVFFLPVTLNKADEVNKLEGSKTNYWHSNRGHSQRQQFIWHSANQLFASAWLTEVVSNYTGMFRSTQIIL